MVKMESIMMASTGWIMTRGTWIDTDHDSANRINHNSKDDINHNDVVNCINHDG